MRTPYVPTIVGRLPGRSLALVLFFIGALAAPNFVSAQCATTTLPVQEGMSVGTCSSLLGGPSQQVVVLFDTRDPAINAPGLDTNWFAPQMHNEVPLGPDTWNRSNLGEVFGICLDDAANPNIYVSATAIFGGGGIGPGGAGGVYRLDGTSGAISVFASLPNGGAGLGNLDHETLGGHFYVSNFDDGLIYHLDSAGAIASTYDHGVDGHNAAALVPIPDDSTSSLTQLGRRIWGLQVNEGEDRLYYGVWWETSTDVAGVENEVWSVALDPVTRDPIAASAQLEFQINAKPLQWGGTAVNPVADITFDATGTRLVLAQRSMWEGNGTGLGNGSHRSYVLEYFGNSGAWVGSPDNQFLVGNYSGGHNAAGGVDLDCEGNVWATGDALHLDPNDWVYGMQRIPAAGGSTVFPWAQTSYLVDYDCQIIGDMDKTLVGDVEHRRSACSTCTIVDEAIDCDADVNGNYSYTFTVTNNSGTDADRVRLIPTGGFTFTPDTILSSIPAGTSATFTVGISGAVPGMPICFEVWLMEDAFNQCCIVDHCIDLPTCCAEIEVIRVECDPANPGVYLFDFSLTNLSAISVDRIFLWPTPATAGWSFGDDEFLSPADFAGPLGNGGITGPLSTTIVGGVPGSTICFEVSVHDSNNGDCCFERICIDLPECDGCDTPDECAIDVIRPCEPVQPGSDEHQAVINVSICNNCSDQEAQFDFSFDGTTGAACPTPYLTPANFTPSSGTTGFVPPGECVEFTVVIDCTGIAPGDSACYDVTFTNTTTGTTTICSGRVTRPAVIGGGGVDPTGGVIDVVVGSSAVVSFDIVNVGPPRGPIEVSFSESTPTISANPGLSIDGLQPGAPSNALIDLPTGTTTVATQVTIPVHDPLAIHTLFLLIDVDGDGAPDPISSANLRSVNPIDCDGSGVNDDIELAIGILTDADGDGVPDVCQSSLPNFIRGDVNADLGLDISDAIFLLGAIFGGGDPVPCLASADVNTDGNVDIGDPINILGVLFSGAPAPSAPYPDCGPGLQGVVECAVTGCP